MPLPKEGQSGVLASQGCAGASRRRGGNRVTGRRETSPCKLPLLLCGRCPRGNRTRQRLDTGRRRQCPAPHLGHCRSNNQTNVMYGSERKRPRPAAQSAAAARTAGVCPDGLRCAISLQRREPGRSGPDCRDGASYYATSFCPFGSSAAYPVRVQAGGFASRRFRRFAVSWTSGVIPDDVARLPVRS